MWVSRMSVTSRHCTPWRCSPRSRAARQVDGPGSITATPSGACTTTLAMAWERPRNCKSNQERPAARVFTWRGYTERSRMTHPDTSSVLTAVARLVAEAPSLREAVARLAATLRTVIPFDRLHVLRLDRA